MVRSPRNRAFAGVLLAQLVLVVAWALATPPDAAPDEHHHVSRAASVVRFDLVGDKAELGGGARDVRLPAFFDRYGEQSACFAFNSHASAACAPSLPGGGREADVTTNAGLSPPAYYAVVGLPLAVAPNVGGVYLARMVGGLLSVAGFAGALVLASRRRGTLALAGVVVAWTPMAQFLAGVVNPSGLELGAAALLWTAGALLVDDEESGDTGRLAAITAVAACAFVVSRQLSPVWLVIVAAALLARAPKGRVRELLATSSVRRALAATVAASVVAAAWLVLYRPLESNADDSIALPGLSRADAYAHSLGRLGFMYRTGLGTFGWLDTFLPAGIELAWTALLGLVVGLAALMAGRRQRLVVLGLGAVVVLLPPLIESTQLDTIGPTWQGRYTLPLAMGIPILAGMAAVVPALAGRITRFVVPVAAAAQFAAFYVALRRYAVGTGGPMWFVGRSTWDAPLPVSVLLLLGLAGCVATAVAVLRLLPTDDQA